MNSAFSPRLAETAADENSRLTFLDFFAGVGLVEEALSPDWQCAWANDIDPKKKSIYDANFTSPEKYVLGDIAGISSDQLPTPIDMAWASFPCQDLSLAGWRHGINGRRSGVFWSFYRLMHQLRTAGNLPGIVVLENVVGLLYGQSFTGLCEALNDLGMNYGAAVMDARRFVPQSRPRVFIVAVDRSVKTEAFELSAGKKSEWTSKALDSAVENLPSNLRERWKWWRMGTPIAPVSPLEDIIDTEANGVRWHSREETNHLLNMMSTQNLAKIQAAKLEPNKSIGFLYRRTREGRQRAEVRFDGIAGCLRTPNGGSSRQTVVIVENGDVKTRLITIREAARLMGVKDSFRLPGSYNEVYKGMGDGVAVPVVRWLSSQLLLPMAISARIRRGYQNARISEGEDILAWGPSAYDLSGPTVER